jgi:hypothetical protein
MTDSSGSCNDTHPWDVWAVLSNAKEETMPERRMDQTPFHFHPPSQFHLRRSAISVAFLMLRTTTFRAQKEAWETFSIYTFRNIVTNEVSFRFSLRSETKNTVRSSVNPTVLLWRSISDYDDFYCVFSWDSVSESFTVRAGVSRKLESSRYPLLRGAN